MDDEIPIPEEALPDQEPPPPTANITVAEAEWNRLQQEARDYKEKYLHALAEGENTRKRLHRDKQETVQHAVQKVIVEFLDPIDQLENALKYADQASPEVKNWAVGFQMILSHFKEVLSGHGVEPFVSEGQPFDPHSHEAIEMVESEEIPHGTVVKELVRGYAMRGKKHVVRPARVHVSKRPTPPQGDAGEINQLT